MRAGADKLEVRDYKGTGGSFILDTDLASEVNGDKVHIKNADAGTTYVSVKDVSLANNIQVTGIKNLLLITDDSKNAVFTGKELNNGGLWDVTPTIKKGTEAFDAAGNAVGTEEQWYLTKIEKLSMTIRKYCWTVTITAMLCGVIPMTHCANGWATCVTVRMSRMVTVCGPVT